MDTSNPPQAVTSAFCVACDSYVPNKSDDVDSIILMKTASMMYYITTASLLYTSEVAAYAIQH